MGDRTFIMIKPDGVQRGLVGEILSRFEHEGYKLVAMKFKNANKDILHKHYAEHVNKGFYPGLEEYMLSGPVVPMVLQCKNAVTAGRKLVGETDPAKSNPGTIRGDLGLVVGRNLVHGSDSDDSAEREIKLWFKDDELVFD